MKVLHLLDHSLPVQSGYAHRSDSILRALSKRGISCVAVTGPKQEIVEQPGSTHYQRMPQVEGDGPLAQARCVQTMRRSLRQILAAERPDLVHAHSPCLNGLAAMGLGTPLIYEVRSSWEDAAVASGRTTESSMRYRVSRALETLVARRADAVVAICEGLRRDLLARGVSERSIEVVGNAIDSSEFVPAGREAGQRIRARLGFDDHLVLGFFGSFFAWEGLDVLIDALPAVIASEPRIRLILAGGGEMDQRLRESVSRLGLDGIVSFVGRVGHAEIPAYYAATDLMVFPRRSLKITEMVTPLKPLEAMATDTIVLASDVGGHRELIEDGATGYLFAPDDPVALADKVLEVLRDKSSWQAIRVHARTYVESARTWDRMAARYESVYERLL